MVAEFLSWGNLNIYKIDSDWLLNYKCHVINQSELLLEGSSRRQGVNQMILICIRIDWEYGRQILTYLTLKKGVILAHIYFQLWLILNKFTFFLIHNFILSSKQIYSLYPFHLTLCSDVSMYISADITA